MGWAKFDDAYDDNDKVLAVGEAGKALHSAAIRWSCRAGTGGRVPAAKLRLLIDERQFTVGVDETIALLVEERLLERSGRSYVIHDFPEYNPEADGTARRREEISSARADAGRLGGERSVATRRERYGSARPLASMPPEANGTFGAKQTAPDLEAFASKQNPLPPPHPPSLSPSPESRVPTPGTRVPDPPGGAPARAREDQGSDDHAPETDPDDLPFADWPPPTDPLGDVVENGSHSPPAEAHVFSAADVVAEYVNASRLATVACVGVPADPSRSRRGQVARVAEQLIRGHPPELLLEAARFCGEHNRPPSVFEDVVGDLERGRRPWTGDRAGSAVAARQDAHSAALRRALDMAAGVTA